MKKIGPIILILLNFSAYAQEWKRYYPNWPGFSSSTYSVKEVYDKGYLTGGCLKKPDNTWPGWIFKTDINGNLLWYRLIDGFTDSDFGDFEMTSDGGFIAGGRYWNEAKQVRDAYVMKFNACAEPEWCSFLPENENCSSEINRIKQMDDGSYICERLKYVWDHHYRWSLIRLSAQGDVIWSNYYDLNFSYFAQVDLGEMKKTSDNCVLITSSVYDSISEDGLLSQMPYWYKVDIDGNLLWDTKWNLLQPFCPAEARFLVEDYKGDYYSGGFVSPWKKSQLYKLSHEGDTLNRYYMNDSPPAISGAQVNTLRFISADSILMSGQAWDTPEGNYWTLQITDTMGNFINRKYEKEQALFVNSIVTSDNKILLVGLSAENSANSVIALYKFNMNLEYDSIYTQPHIYDSLCPHAIVSDTIPMPGNCRVVSVPQPIPMGDIQTLTLTPNPAANFVSVGIPEFYAQSSSFALGKMQQFRPLTGEVGLRMYGLAGKKVLEETFDAAERNHNIDVSHYPAGMYLLQLNRQNETVATGKLVIVR